MLSNINKNKYLLSKQWFFSLVGVFISYLFFIYFACFTFAITVPANVYNGAYFTPVCGPGAVYFDVPNLYAPQNCGTSVTFDGADAVTYEFRDLDGDGNPIPPSAYSRALLGAPGIGGCMNSSATNYNPSATYSDGSCTFNQINGCTNPSATNYNPAANHDNGSCTYNSSAPISAPSVVYNGAHFTPVCGGSVVYFDAPNAFAPQNCGDSATFGYVNATYELRGLDINGVPVPPSISIRSVYSSPGEKPNTSIVKKKIQSIIPIVSISSPTKGSVISNNLSIIYKSTDENDLGDATEKATQGLGITPVSIFYTDKSFDWNPYSGILINSDLKNLIVKDLPAIGKYDFSVKDLIPGNMYRIIVDATDNSGLTGETVSDYFSVDLTPPTFNVKTDRTLVKNGSVTISVNASKVLQEAPIVKVTQKGGQPINVEMKGDKDTYQGTYTVQAGYDGTAKIDISGKDMVGNVGTEITNGGTFNIGVNPPPKPVITSDINKTVTYNNLTSLKGTVREDTEVMLSVNGTNIATVKPDSKGNFIFDKIKLDKTKNKGVNYLSVVSRDIFGTMSESANVEIKYNVAPTISILAPTNKSLLSGQIDIIAKGTDENFDTLLYTYDIISLSDYNSKTLKNNWTTVATDVPGGSFTYDTTELDDGDYMIRAEVSDGYVIATSTPVSITIKSSSAYFRFENGRKTVTKDSSVLINGRAIIPSSLVTSVGLKAISYSLDSGLTWTDVKFDNTVLVTEQKFSVVFDNLSEGTHPIMWRIIDSRDLTSNGSYTIVVDNTAPSSPVVKTPKNNSVITNDDDEDLTKDGVQISVAGTAEAGSVASLVFNGQTLTTKVSLLGEFSFSGITLNKKGKQEMQLFATDEAGNKSDATDLAFTYNNPPVITIINPQPFGGLSSKAVVSWNITDIDGDNIKNVEVSYRNNGGVFKTLVSNAEPNGTYIWDTSNLPESSGYELKITATDSISPASAVVNFFVDRTPPTLVSFSANKKMANNKVTISGMGVASDAVSGVQYVEYSIKSGKNTVNGPWYKGTITKGYLQNHTSFIINYPNDLPDNAYTIYVRAVDTAGNVSSELSQDVYVDRTAPRIGSFFIMKNNLDLIPDQDGNISYYKNSVFTLAVSIEDDAKSANLMIGNVNLKLNKNIASGLWEAITNISNESAQNILITAEDDSMNITKDKKIGTLSAMNNGNVVVSNNGANNEFLSGVSIIVFKYDESTGQYNKFIPIIDGVSSPVVTDRNGQYSLILPAGTYQLVAMKSGYRVIKKDLILPRTEIVNSSFATVKIGGLDKIISDIFNRWFY